MVTEKSRETRLRRMARRQGLTVIKSRTRDPLAIRYGRYWVVDTNQYRPLDDPWREGRPTGCGFPAEGSDLDGVEQFLRTKPGDR